MKANHAIARSHSAAIGLAFLLAGCHANSQPPSASQPTPVETSVHRGDVTLTVRADRDRIAVADRLGLSVFVTAPEGVNVTMPTPDKTLGDFTVLDARENPSVPEGRLRRTEQRYLLESYISGKQVIPALTIHYAPAGPPASQSAIRNPRSAIEPGDLTSQPLPIEVATELSGQIDPTKFRGIKGELPIPTARRWMWFAIASACVVLAAWAIWLWKRRRRAEYVAPPIPPHIWAREQLARLAAEKLAERGLFHDYYFRLSAIVRQYIERRFNLMAPERTTEEFLVEASRSVLLSSTHKELLATFLRAADEVKFARYEPSLDEAERAMYSAREFVQQTVPFEPTAQPTSPPYKGGARGGSSLEEAAR